MNICEDGYAGNHDPYEPKQRKRRKAKPTAPKEAKSPAHVSFCMESNLKNEVDKYCQKIDMNASQLVRWLLRQELKNRSWERMLK